MHGSGFYQEPRGHAWASRIPADIFYRSAQDWQVLCRQPIVKTYSQLLICEHCDSVYRQIDLAAGTTARCTRCDAVLYRANRMSVDRWLALTVTAAIVFIIANVCPVVRISLQGLHNEATMWQAAAALGHGAAAPIAVPTALTIVLVPLMQITLLLWVLGFAHRGRRAPGFALVMRSLQALKPWSMVEVGMLGLLVAIIKLTSFVQVAPGPGIWATAVLMVLITIIAKCDLHRLWDLTEHDADTQVAPA